MIKATLLVLLALTLGIIVGHVPVQVISDAGLGENLRDDLRSLDSRAGDISVTPQVITLTEVVISVPKAKALRTAPKKDKGPVLELVGVHPFPWKSGAKVGSLR